MDPLQNIYYYNETTAQSTRQHPMDGYLKVELKVARRSYIVEVEAEPTDGRAPPFHARTAQHKV